MIKSKIAVLLLLLAAAFILSPSSSFGFGGFGGFGGEGNIDAHAHEDFYEILELTMDATDAEIKKAYRKLSLKYHPDKNAGNADADEKFHKIARAYEVLSDTQKRQVYDLEGIEGLEKEERGGGRANSPFDSFFGGGKQRGPDAAIDMPVTLEELFNGAKKEARFTKNVICRKCRGTGAKNGKTTACKTCGGQGVVMVQQRMGPGFTVQMQQPCSKCGGKGRVFRHHCPHCHGHKVVKEEKTLVAEIERGMPSNHHIVFERASEQRPGMIPGDVIFRLHQVPHAHFRRAGDDLHFEMEISLEEALLGYSKDITHLDNRILHIDNGDITNPFEVRVIQGQGMPYHNYPSQRGNLHVLHRVQYPKKLTKKQKQMVVDLLD